MRKALIFAASTLAVAACAPGADIVSDHRGDAATPRLAVQFAGADGPLLVDVTGNPFNESDQARNIVVLEGVRRAVSDLGLALTTDHVDAPRANLHIVVVLNPLRGDGSASLCEKSAPPPTQPASGAVQMEAAVCESGTALSTASGSLSVRALDDPAYVTLVRQTTEALFPDLYLRRLDNYHATAGRFGFGF